MGCNCGKPKCDGKCGISPAVLQINNPSECVIFHKVDVPASMGDSTTNPPKTGAYKNVLLYYEADQTSWLYSSDGIPVRLTNGITNYEDAINLPQINGETLIGDKSSADLKLADAPMVITIASGNTVWSGADTAEDIYNFFLNQGKVNIVFEGSENYGYEIVSAAYIPGEQKMMCMTTVASVDTGSSPVEFSNNALYGLMTFYTAGKAVDVGELDLQPKLSITDFTGLNMTDGYVLEGVPATGSSIGMVKPSDGLSVSSDGTLTVIDHVFDTVADMKASTGLKNGDYAQTLGFHSINDGGGALYKISDSGTADESTVIAVGELYADLIYDDKMNVKQFGAKADGTTDNTSIINIILGLGKNCLYFPDGTYLINDKLTLTTCYQITGQSMRGTVIKAPDGFASWDSTYKNLRFISNITFDGVAKNGNTCLQGAMAFSKWDNVLIKNYNIAYMPEAGTWINEFNYIYVTACNYGFYNDTVNDLNNNNFVSCYFQGITNVAFSFDGKAINFDNCNIENCGVAFSGRLGRDYNLHNCYLENNTVIFNINKASYNSNVVVDNCWLYGNTTGWLATLFCPTSVDNVTASLIISNSYIENVTKDTVKPFAFQGTGTKTYWGVSLLNNSYNNIKTTDSYNIYYDDLFDLTNCPQYTWPANPVTFKTDLPLYKYQNIIWYQESTGNMLGANRTNRRIKMVGRYAIEKTSGNIEITPDKKYGCIYPTKSNIPVLIRYSDGSIDYSFMSTSGTSFTIVPKYNSRTTVEVIFNNEFDTLLS